MGREEGSAWGTRVYLWWIHVDIWQNQYNIVKLKNKKKILKKVRLKLIGAGEMMWIFLSLFNLSSFCFSVQSSASSVSLHVSCVSLFHVSLFCVKDQG